VFSRASFSGADFSRRLFSAALALSFGIVLLVALPATRAAAAPCDAPVVNEIACENTKTGNPSSEWQISSSGSSSIQGYATDISVNRGSTIGFKIKTTSTNYQLNIYRMGYYGGMGARKVATVNPTAFPNQPACQTQSSTGLIDCGNWTQNASWAVPNTAVSGIYFAHVVTSSGSAESHIVFVVRDDASRSDLFFQTSDTTWQAYNDYGGNSLYEGNPAGRAYKVSYNRPFDTNAETPEDFVWNAEYPMVRFLEANGYDVSYTTGVDTERRGSLITNHKAFLSVGHDEYWSGGQRANVEAARSAGVNLAFFSGNESFWKTRWENSISTGNATYRTLVSYKETHANAKIDPSSAWTGTWRDPRFSPPADGGRPENGLTGTLFMVNCCMTDMEVDAVDGQMRFWRNTRVANLNGGQSTTLGSEILGYEWDESPDNGFQPAGLIRLSTTTKNGVDYLQDYGSTYAPGTATHHLTMYRAPSGALVFGAGTVQWSWGLDNNHSGGPASTADDAVRQATVNLFADMGVQPATLQSGLSAATASSDTTPPTSTISAPADGATVPVGQLTVSGTASDAGGGKVGGVEVSTDNGTSWHPATGRGSWSYTFTPGSSGTVTIRTRATDDSLRIETPSAGRTITVGTGMPPPPGSCPCTIWPSTATPAVASDSDSSAIEVGVKFRASQAGSITGIRFYKGSGNTGTHVGSLWSMSGTKLGSATFTGESGSGWQQVNFASPVTVAANTTYVASYYAPNGHYSTSDGYFATPTTSGPLTALQDGADGSNGVYKYGAAGFPTAGFASSNYWVDVVYDTSTSDTTKPTVTAKQPAAGATGVDTSTDVTAMFSEPVSSSSITMTLKDSNNASVNGSTAYDTATRRASFTPSPKLKDSETYTASVSDATDAAGNTMDAVSWSFTTAAAPPADTTPPTITARTPSSGATGVATSTTVTATFNEAVQSSTIKMTLSGPGGAVSGSVDYDSTSRKATFTPNSALAASTTYTVNVSGAKDLGDNTMSPVSWSFTTAAASSACPCTIWPSSATPDLDADPDNGGVEVGVKFRTTQAGTITKIRFYKGSENSGTHIGSLWTRTGTKLASVTFTGESSSGWQEATFANPVSVAANTTYVASYYAPSGHYSLSENYFVSATTRGPLTALKNGTDGVNGVYKYGTSGFPTSGYQSSNYWVDVVLTTN
jgi:Domain of unknown function (DUF4082)/Bacterial Ig-like domain